MVVKELANAKIENWPIAKIVGELECSVIREILKFSSQPGVISFAGGLPAPELFPLDAIREALGSWNESVVASGTPLRGPVSHFYAATLSM